MTRYLPFVLLVSTFSLFGITWIIYSVDPDIAAWYFFAMLILLIFAAIFGYLGLILYFLRTRLYRRYSANWYIFTSFKMAFFVALFVSLIMALAILQLLTTINIFFAIVAVCLFALWSYLGKKIER